MILNAGNDRGYIYSYKIQSILYLLIEGNGLVGDIFDIRFRFDFLVRTQNKLFCKVFFAASSDLDRFGSVAVVRIRIFFLLFVFYSRPFTPRTGRLYSKCTVFPVD
jgi:hypothetical protein